MLLKYIPVTMKKLLALWFVKSQYSSCSSKGNSPNEIAKFAEGEYTNIPPSSHKEAPREAHS